MVNLMAHLRVLFSGVVLGVLLGSMIIGAYEIYRNAPTPVPHGQRLEVEVVEINSTTRLIVCQVSNTGAADLTITEVAVNGSFVKTVEPLPITTSPRNSYTISFKHEGPWGG